VTGKTQFRDTPGDVMNQHQHAPVPLDLPEAVPQPVIVLLVKLLEKDPARRFQNPPELLKALPMIGGVIDARRKIARQSFHKTRPADSRVGTRKPPARPAPEKIFRSQITGYRKRCFWPRRGYLFSGSCMGKQGCKCRYNRCLGWGRKVYARQPLAPTDGF
jgi:hypothetical protein